MKHTLFLVGLKKSKIKIIYLLKNRIFTTATPIDENDIK